jgi:hypothetical protein
VIRIALSGVAVVALLAAAGTGAVHASEPNLTTGSWSLVELNGRPIRGEATVNFTRIGWIGVKTPCGPLWGWYRQSTAALSIQIAGGGRWQGTGSPCHGLDYRLLLGRVRSFTLEGDRLLFRNAAGGALARLVRKQ